MLRHIGGLYVLPTFLVNKSFQGLQMPWSGIFPSLSLGHISMDASYDAVTAPDISECTAYESNNCSRDNIGCQWWALYVSYLSLLIHPPCLASHDSSLINILRSGKSAGFARLS